jgi:hypothetical protein
MCVVTSPTLQLTRNLCLIAISHLRPWFGCGLDVCGFSLLKSCMYKPHLFSDKPVSVTQVRFFFNYIFNLEQLSERSDRAAGWTTMVTWFVSRKPPYRVFTPTADLIIVLRWNMTCASTAAFALMIWCLSQRQLCSFAFLCIVLEHQRVRKPWSEMTALRGRKS